MWPSLSNSSSGKEGLKGKEVLKGYNLILLDDDNFHVHAYVYADKWQSISKIMVEGGLYEVSNFYTKDALGSFKPVSSKILINFSPSTKVEKIEEDDFMIPMHKFEFVDLSDLFGIVSAYVDDDKPDYSTDIIGVLEDFENEKKIPTMYGENNIAKFRITDGRHSHKVSIWGQLAITTDSNYKEITKEQPIIVIVTSTKLRKFRNSVQISTMPFSKIYLNLENDVVSAMRQRLDEEGYVASEKALGSPSLAITESSSALAPVIETLTLKQLSERTSTEFQEAEMPPQSFIFDIAYGLRRAMKLNLFNFDVIRDTRVGNNYLVIDINYFPGYAKMSGYEKVLTDFFCDVFNKKQFGHFDGQLGMNCEKEVRILVGNNGLVEDEDVLPLSPLKMEEEFKYE
ncbi:hypothetical protein POM88_005799 [Heracleum sosnowskyi]|uniref:inositol-1,3,4-trisphosphate 5/6-kinase n=1 Tax=Heracleum sosnowskyi TaxID=360622 RepID=A0AAD8J470_9APIA|nr:hypothetical protein POM88_005799 [Heracleum sosnowskyi]